jgi:hypothetical protein
MPSHERARVANGLGTHLVLDEELDTLDGSGRGLGDGGGDTTHCASCQPLSPRAHKISALIASCVQLRPSPNPPLSIGAISGRAIDVLKKSTTKPGMPNTLQCQCRSAARRARTRRGERVYHRAPRELPPRPSPTAAGIIGGGERTSSCSLHTGQCQRSHSLPELRGSDSGAHLRSTSPLAIVTVCCVSKWKRKGYQEWS